MICPACTVDVAENARECPSCGIIFDKWREKQERERRAAEAALSAMEPSTPAVDPIWTRRAAAVAVVAVWLLGWAWYMRRHALHRQRAPAQAIGEFVEVRDPVTGDMRRLRIERARSNK